MPTRDTAPEIRRRQIEAYRAMGPQRRVEVGFSLSEEVLGITAAAIRARDEALDDRGAHLELLRILHGSPVAEAVAEVLHPR